MVGFQCWTREGKKFSIQGLQYNQIFFDEAERKGAIRLKDDLGDVFIKLQDEWINFGYEKS